MKSVIATYKNLLTTDGFIKPKIYRRRFIPDEIVCMENDEFLLLNDEVIVTKWNTIRPRKDFSHGISCYWLKKEIKVSKIFDKDNKFVYYYCDIIEEDKERAVELNNGNSLVFNDLLLDVIIYENGFVKVMDIGEIADALESKLITLEIAKKALRRLDYLLNEIYNGKFYMLTEYIDNALT